MPVYRDKRNGRWRFRKMLTLPNGRRIRLGGTGAVNTRVAAEAAERAAIEQALRAMGKPEPKEVPTLQAFQEEFVRTYVRANNKESERRSKELILQAHIVPRFGRMRIDAIGARDIETFKAELLEEKELGRKTVNNVIAVLSKILRYAEELEVIARGPRVRLLKVERRTVRYLDFEEYAALLKVAESEPEWLAAILLGGDAGLRRGEIRALQWDDWDRQAGRLMVQRSLWEDVEGATKGWNQRAIPLTDRLASALRAIRHLRGPYVFAGEDGKPLTREAMRWNLPRLCRRAGIRPCGWHALRHSFCTHLAMRGAPAKTIQALAGHADLTTTLRYMHLVEGAVEQAIGLLAPRCQQVANGG